MDAQKHRIAALNVKRRIGLSINRSAGKERGEAEGERLLAEIKLLGSVWRFINLFSLHL